jgi:hypothetical protein
VLGLFVVERVGVGGRRINSERVSIHRNLGVQFALTHGQGVGNRLASPSCGPDHPHHRNLGRFRSPENGDRERFFVDVNG